MIFELKSEAQRVVAKAGIDVRRPVATIFGPMRVLFLGPDSSPIAESLKSFGEDVTTHSDPLTVQHIHDWSPEFVVSHGYRHMLKGSVLELIQPNAINLHISYLPWNRGADPNVWSFIEGTPKGVTIHYIDEGIDTGDIISQVEVSFKDNGLRPETLKSTYETLQSVLVTRFSACWNDIRSGCSGRKRQQGLGSVHYAREIGRISHLLTQGWDTPVRSLTPERQCGSPLGRQGLDTR